MEFASFSGPFIHILFLIVHTDTIRAEILRFEMFRNLPIECNDFLVLNKKMLQREFQPDNHSRNF